MTAGSVILQGPGTPRVHSRGAQPAPRCCDPRSPVPVSAPDADAIFESAHLRDEAYREMGIEYVAGHPDQWVHHLHQAEARHGAAP